MKLIDYYRKEELAERTKDSAPQTAIRTYKEKCDRVIDHRIGEQFSYKETLDGKGLEKIIQKVLDRQVG